MSDSGDVPLGYKKVYVEFWSWRHEVRQISTADAGAPLTTSPFETRPKQAATATPKSGAHKRHEGHRHPGRSNTRGSKSSSTTSSSSSEPSSRRQQHVNPHRRRSVSWHRPEQRRILLEAVLQKLRAKLVQAKPKVLRFVEVYPQLQEEFQRQGLSLESHRIDIMLAIIRELLDETGADSTTAIKKLFEKVDLKHFFALHNVMSCCTSEKTSKRIRQFHNVLYMCRTTCPSGLDLISEHSQQQWKQLLDSLNVKESRHAVNTRQRLRQGLVYVDRYKLFTGNQTKLFTSKISKDSYYKLMPMVTLNVPVGADLSFVKNGLRQISGQWVRKQRYKRAGATFTHAGGASDDCSIVVVGDRWIVFGLDDGRFGLRRGAQLRDPHAADKAPSELVPSPRRGSTVAEEVITIDVAVPWSNEVQRVCLLPEMRIWQAKRIVASALKVPTTDLHDAVFRYPQIGDSLADDEIVGDVHRRAIAISDAPKAMFEIRGGHMQWEATKQSLYGTLPPLRGTLWMMNRVRCCVQ